MAEQVPALCVCVCPWTLYSRYPGTAKGARYFTTEQLQASRELSSLQLVTRQYFRQRHYLQPIYWHHN
jgi:hypothetical protein